MARHFDAYCLLDFSARSSPSPAKPCADALWLGCVSGAGKAAVSYHRTRAAAMAAWSEWVGNRVQRGRRVLCGFDFALGYPVGFAEALRVKHGWRSVWRELADRIKDDDRNSNNRFAVADEMNRRTGDESTPGPFWGGPAGAATPTLERTRSFDWPYVEGASWSLARLRVCESCCPTAQEVWKLSGAGSVGSQTLLGIAALRRALDTAAWAEHARVWPTQTGFADNVETLLGGRSEDPAVVIVEAYPSLLGDAVDALLDRHAGIRDAAQADAWCRWARAEDRAGRLGRWFAVPAGLSSAQQQACEREEGWIFGVPGPGDAA